MTIITPGYYQKFKCIADKCQHSCCIGWEIDVDDTTLTKYNSLNNDFANKIKSNIDFIDTPHFKLGQDERCPFLNSKGLCEIIINLGEDMLCQICSDHPRFRNYYDDFTEIGLGLACEVAAEIILTNKEKVSLNLSEEALRNPIINFREKLFNVLQDRTLSFEQRINNMLDMIDSQLPLDVDWYSVFNELEKMDKKWDEYLLRIKDGLNFTSADCSLDTAYEQLVVYLVFRHFTDCQYDSMIKERVLFAALIYKIIKTMNTSNTLKELIEISRIFSCEIEYSDENICKLLSKLN